MIPLAPVYRVGGIVIDRRTLRGPIRLFSQRDRLGLGRVTVRPCPRWQSASISGWHSVTPPVMAIGGAP